MAVRLCFSLGVNLVVARQVQLRKGGVVLFSDPMRERDSNVKASIFGRKQRFGGSWRFQANRSDASNLKSLCNGMIGEALTRERSQMGSEWRADRIGFAVRNGPKAAMGSISRL